MCGAVAGAMRRWWSLDKQKEGPQKRCGLAIRWDLDGHGPGARGDIPPDVHVERNRWGCCGRGCAEETNTPGSQPSLQ